MKRRDFLKGIGVGAAALAASAPGWTEAKNGKNKPNIIFILADDLGYGDLGCYGQTKIQTPHIDAMAAQGMKFTDHYSGSTVCAPSRSCIMTGLHTGHTPVRGNREVEPEGQSAMPADTITLAHLMKRAGYTTGMMGKWGLGAPGSVSAPNVMGIDYFYGYNCQRQAHRYYPTHLWRNEEKIMLPGNADGGRKTYAGDLIEEEVLGFIRRSKNKPFFLYLPFTIPHAELHVPEEDMKKYRGKLEESKAYGNPEPYGFKGYNHQPEPHVAFAAMVSRLDSDVGKIVALLKELDLEENTLVLFSSDNGPHLEGGADPRFFNSGGPLRGFKRDLYEGGIRVPLIARWPGRVKAGSTCDHPSAFWDLMPTCLELGGAKALIPKDIDGISYAPALLGKNQKEHEYLYWEYEAGAKRAVRQGEWKAVFFHGKNRLELYNLKDDLGEKNNIADKHPEIASLLFKIMSAAHVDSPVFKIAPMPEEYKTA